MSYSKSEYMLKYQKAKAKLLEYDVPREDYPKFRLNYRDLAFPTILTISDYAEAIINDNLELQEDLKGGLFFCSEFYDAAVRAREQEYHDVDFLLTGIISYIFQSDFGSAMVLLKLIDKNLVPNDMRQLLYYVLEAILLGRFESDNEDELLIALKEVLHGADVDNLIRIAENKCDIRVCKNEIDFFFAESTYAVIKIAIDRLAVNWLPRYSLLPNSAWSEYFKKKNSLKILWPAQDLIGKKDLLQGKSGIVQLPTGVGKTKSIELIVRSMFMSGRGNNALIVAPLRALCNEITDDMRRSFGDEASINQFSDILELDIDFQLWDEGEKRILVCTPEKLKYVIHHQDGFKECINTFIFDEGHMFDDESRGALYELLVTDIKSIIDASKQIVVLSAVLPNGDSILDWIDNKGALACDKNIKSTKKVVGFTSAENQIHYYSDSFLEEDFYIPRAIKGKELKRKKNSRKKKYFPENNPQDIALYFANQLCSNGGIAIYLAQRRSIPKILSRLVDVSEKGIDFTKIYNESDASEISKLQKLIIIYYGEEHNYSKAAQIGVFPHYSSLPNGLRVAIEYAYRKNLIKAVACTSTLAQGVNIPIKYLIMTSFNSARNMMTTRNFQNLIGRTARSGVYTEGSVLVTDTKIYDNRNNRGAGRYKWKDVISLFDMENSEKCGSAILSIVQNFHVDYDTDFSFLGSYICSFICNHITEDWVTLLEFILKAELKKHDKDNEMCRHFIKERLKNYKQSIDVMENDLIYAFDKESASGNEGTADISEIAKIRCESSLAYYLANPDEKNLLQNMYQALVGKINAQMTNVHVAAKSMISLDMAKRIIDFIELEEINEKAYDESDLLTKLVDLYCEIYEPVIFSTELCTNWMRGESYETMRKLLNVSEYEIEKVCAYDISYQLCFLLGNVIDYLNQECVNIDKLSLLQKKLKYGVCCETEISICERIFNERMIAKNIARMIGRKDIDSDRITGAITMQRDEILEMLEEYPLYFYNKIRSL